MHLFVVEREGGKGCINILTDFLFFPLSTTTRPPWQWEWGNQDSFLGNVGTVLGHGGGDGWYRVQWDTSNTTNSYQYMPEHQDIARFNDPLENPLAALFPSWAAEDERQYVDVAEEEEQAEGPGGAEGGSAVLNATNVLPLPEEALAEAGTSCLLALLDDGLWRGVAATRTPGDSSCGRLLMWGAMGRLGLGSAARMAAILQHPSAQPAVAAAAAHVIGGGGELGGGEDALDGAMLLVASAALTGPAAVVRARLVGEPGLLSALVRIIATGGSTPGAHALLALSILSALVASSEVGPSSEPVRALVAVLREDRALWEGFVAMCLDGLLDASRVCQTAAHVMVLRLLRAVLLASSSSSSSEGDDAEGRLLKAQLLPWPRVKDRLVRLMEAYAGLAESAVVMEELLLLMVAWIGPGAAGAEAEAAAMTILANALLDRFDRVNDTFLHAPHSVLLSAPSLLQRAVRSRADAAARERSVDRLLRAGTLNFLFEGEYDWTGREAGHVLELRALLQLLLESGAPGREEQIVSLPLVRALLPVLRSPVAQGGTEGQQGAQDAAVVAGVLQILASRLPPTDKPGLAPLQSRIGQPQPHHQGRRRRRQRLLWAALGGDLASAVCATYHRVAQEEEEEEEDGEVGALALRILASVVAELGVLEQQHLDVLLAEEAAAEAGDAASRPLPPMAAAKLRIVGAACRSFEADANIDTDALVGTVVAWLERAGEDKAVMDAALQLLLNLVDNARAWDLCCADCMR